MDKKITIPAGIALMVVLAVAGMLAIFSYSPAPAHAALSDGSISQSGTGATVTTTIMVTTDAAVADDAVIEVTFPEDFRVAEGLVATDVTVSKQTGTDTAVGVAVDSFVDTTLTTPRTFSVAVNQTDALLRPAADDVIIIEIANDRIVYPTISEANADLFGISELHHVTISVGGAANTTTATYQVNSGAPVNEISVIPNKPNKSDDVVFTFTTEVGEEIETEDYIVLVLQEKYQVPESISASDVTIITSPNINGSKNPKSVIVDDQKVFKVDKDDPLIFIEVPDMDTSDDGLAGADLDGIPQGHKVTVTIAKAAGIKAPTEAKKYEARVALAGPGRAGRDDLKDAIEYGVAGQASEFRVTHMQTLERLLTLSGEDFGRNDEAVATAKGWPGSSITFFADLNGNGELDEGAEAAFSECSNVSNDDNVAECTFMVGNEFVGGHGTSGLGGCDGTDEPAAANFANGALTGKCNLINAFDSENEYSAINWEDDVLEIKASLSLSPSEGNPGDKIDVVLRDFPANEGIISITLAGASDPLCTNCGTTNASGGESIEVTIPNVPLGTRFLEVTVDDGTADGVKEDTDLSVGGASVLATPTLVIPNQRVNLTGSGFSRRVGNDPDVMITSITIGGDMVTLPTSEEQRVVDSGGTWSMAVDIPLTDGTVAGGDQVLTVTDSLNRVGQATLEFKERSVSVSPETGKIDSTVTITGENFPGLNDEGVRNIRVTVSYGGGLESEDVEPDVNGRWQTQITVPDNVTIPSTNSVRVSFPVPGGTPETSNFRHQVPAATISLSPTAGPEGSTVTLMGSGFNRFRPYTSITVGNIPLTVTPVPTTDRNGNLSFSFQIPGIDSGTHNVVLKVGEVTASSTFSVSDATGVIGADTASVDAALEPLLTAGTLDRVFYFNNATKAWQWHIVDPAFASTNNLDQVVSGAPLWIRVTEDTSVVINGQQVDFTCAGDDCWNLITFP